MNDWYEERAAIMEYDGGMTREEAEIEAYKDMVKNNYYRRVLPENNTQLVCENPFQNI